jgi:hypothetical protein
MYIGSIAAKDSVIKGVYRYRKRGVDIPAPPDLYPDIATENIDLLSGNLFKGEKTGWRWTNLLDVGVDIVIDLDRSCFVDRIILRQETGSGIGSVEVLASSNGNELSYAGRADAATGQALEQSLITVIVGTTLDKLVIRLNSYFKNIVITSLDVIAAVFDTPVIYPIPRIMEIKSGTAITTTQLDKILLPKNALEDTLFAAEHLKEKLLESIGKKIAIEFYEQNSSFENALIVGLSEEWEALNILSEKPKKEGFVLIGKKGTVYLIGADRNGLLYGSEKLLSLLENGQVPLCKIDDYPRMQFRGIHTGLPPREEIPFFKRFIRNVLVPMGYNTVFLEFAGGMRFDRRPEITRAWIEGNKKAAEGKWPPFPHGSMNAGGSVLEKSEVADLVAYARLYGLDVIPEVQSLSHVQYITAAYPEIAEITEEQSKRDKYDLNKEDIPPSEFYAHSYCASNEKSYEIIYDIIDEIVETVKPKEYVHMGHDEVYQIGICPVCKSLDPADLLAKHINRMHDYLAKKNLKMMIWGDMLHDVTRYKTPSAIDKIPKDIVLLDFIWYFHLDKDIEDRLLGRGFKVIMGNMYSSHYPRYESRIVKEGMIGAQVSTWCRFDEYTLGMMGKIFDFLYSANMMWNDTYTEKARRIYTKIIMDKMPKIRSQIHGEPMPSTAKTKKSVPLRLPDSQFTTDIPEELLKSVNISRVQILNDVAFDLSKPQFVLSPASAQKVLPAAVNISVDQKFDSIVFLHTAGINVRIPSFKPLFKIGSYTVHYEDGTKETIPVEYGGNILVWSKRFAEPMDYPYYRHEGYKATYPAYPYIQSKTPSGKDVTCYGYEWINPHKDKTIRSITLSAEGDFDSSVILLAITGIVM